MVTLERSWKRLRANADIFVALPTMVLMWRCHERSELVMTSRSLTVVEGLILTPLEVV